MKQNIRNNTSGPNRIIAKLGAEKKKTVIALCLITVMVFMWVKMLGGKTPRSAEAALMAQQMNAGVSTPNQQLKISFIDLPKVKGRNDVLAGDFFAADGWRDFIRAREGLTGAREVNVAKDGSEELSTRIARKLKLEAIAIGENPRAFINDKLLSVGDEILVRDGVDTCECEVIAIEENEVFLRCREAEIQLKLTKATEKAIEK